QAMPRPIAVRELRAQARFQAPPAALDGDTSESPRFAPLFAEGPAQKGSQDILHGSHQPPCSCGMNRLCSTVGSKSRINFPGLPSLPSATARKPLPVSSLKRCSASATALTSDESNSCRVSADRSITICTPISLLLDLLT